MDQLGDYIDFIQLTYKLNQQTFEMVMSDDFQNKIQNDEIDKTVKGEFQKIIEEFLEKCKKVLKLE